ncbi:MAG: DUF4118 domain-containing protein, partial [Syntrophales bacterium]|nr:DUF4118 domain-containing protein [Syntrophales bacterium]
MRPGGAAAGRWPVWLMYAFAVVATAATMIIRLGLKETFGEHLFLIVFIIPILLSAYAGGLGPGLAATLMSAATTGYFIIPPRYFFYFADRADGVQWLILLVNGIFISALSEALHRSRQRAEKSWLLQAVTLASVGDGVITTDIRGNITFLNPEAERLTGWRQQEATGRPLSAIFSIINAETRQPGTEEVEKVLLSGERAILADDLILLNREGGERAIAASATAIKQADGAREGVVLVFHDNSEKKRTLREIQRLASFPQLNPFPVLEVDAAGAITFYNQGAVEALKKLGPECSLADFLPPDLEEIQAAARQTGEKLFQRQVRIKEAVFSEAIFFAAPFDVLRFYTIDITARHQAEEARLRALMDLQQANESLQTEIWERQAAEETLQVALQFLEIAHRHTEMKPLLEAFVSAVKAFTGCEAVGIRVLHAGGEIPYLAYQGFSQQFYE